MRIFDVCSKPDGWYYYLLFIYSENRIKSTQNYYSTHKDSRIKSTSFLAKTRNLCSSTLNVQHIPNHINCRTVYIQLEKDSVLYTYASYFTAPTKRTVNYSN